jgi:hypothetical protein
LQPPPQQQPQYQSKCGDYFSECGATWVNNNNYYISHSHSPLSAAALKWILKRGIHLASLHLPKQPIIPIKGFLVAAEVKDIRTAVVSLAYNGRLDKVEMVSLNECSYIKDVNLVAVLSRCCRYR